MVLGSFRLDIDFLGFYRLVVPVVVTNFVVEWQVVVVMKNY